MDSNSPIPNQLKALFGSLLSPDASGSAAAINTYYDKEAKLTNPYLLLNGRDDIIKSYATLVASNMDLDCQIDSVVYDPSTQKATIQLVQISQPKALGGLVPIRINQTIDLQLEATDANAPQKLFIVSHSEKHFAQEYLSHLPVVGGFYETQLRSAVGQLTLAGGEVLEKYKVLDAVPVAVDKAKNAVESATKTVTDMSRTATQRARQTAREASEYATASAATATQVASDTAAKARGIATSTVEYTGLTSLLNSTFHWIDVAKATVTSVAATAKETVQQISSTTKDVAATLIEEGKGISVSCYSPTCKPGQVCYAPTCARGRTLSVNLTVDNFQSIIKGMYLEGQRTAGLLSVQ
ncbi:UNVERIFIED_CONTAM: hypothetical protein HDU68_001123 [Siphonaria sp. JEL0065]|nr:hypothetical protein HDU68_001123 [Siphonaria sp. JEL0065]